jgi:Flp pilus assembly protein TadG
MLTSIRAIARRFRRDERGNVFILFGACAIPLLLLMGGVIDLARYSRYKMELANALDSAALALGRKGEEYTEEQAKEFVQDYIASFDLTDSYFTLDEDDYVVTKTEEGFRVAAVGSVETIFLPLGAMARNGVGITSMDLNLAAEVVHNSNRLELALVLDNTGSMNCAGTVTTTCANDWASPSSDSRIVALKDAAKTLVDTLMKDDMEDPDQIKIGLVPFEGMVNVASTGFDVTNPPSWIEWTNKGQATWTGRNFRSDQFDVDADGDTTDDRVGHKWLFNKLTAEDSRVKWAGCVEMRAGVYELSDAAPDTSTPDSLFVPFFAPDEPDSGGTYYNSYMADQSSSSSVSTRQRDLLKYSSNSWISFNSSMDYDGSTSPYTRGPNRGCPRPIVPLTNADSKATIKTAIDNMIAYWATGTYIPVGLMWGWHVLSPGIPYEEGLAPGDEYYDETVKAIVLLTDGDNQVQPGGVNHNISNYNAYNYVGLSWTGQANRLATTASAAEDALDTKTASLCTSVKGAGIRLYTITFGTLSAATQTMMENCATLDEGERLYYHAPNSSDLEDIFVRIGEDLTRVHLSM